MSRTTELTREEIIKRASQRLQALTGESDGGLLLTFNNQTHDFNMLSINSNEEDILNLLVLGMEALRDIASSQTESMQQANRGKLN